MSRHLSSVLCGEGFSMRSPSPYSVVQAGIICFFLFPVFCRPGLFEVRIGEGLRLLPSPRAQNPTLDHNPKPSSCSANITRFKPSLFQLSISVYIHNSHDSQIPIGIAASGSRDC